MIEAARDDDRKIEITEGPSAADGHVVEAPETLSPAGEPLVRPWWSEGAWAGRRLSRQGGGKPRLA
jgi:hypothetical protein